MGFPTKNDHFGVFWGYHHLRKHPCIYIYILYIDITCHHFSPGYLGDPCIPCKASLQRQEYEAGGIISQPLQRKESGYSGHISHEKKKQTTLYSPEKLTTVFMKNSGWLENLLYFRWLKTRGVVLFFLPICWGFRQWHIPEPSLGRDPKKTDCGRAFAKLWESERPAAGFFSIEVSSSLATKDRKIVLSLKGFDCWFCWGCSIFDAFTQFAFVPKWHDALKWMVSCSMYHWPSTIFGWRIN